MIYVRKEIRECRLTIIEKLVSRVVKRGFDLLLVNCHRKPYQNGCGLHQMSQNQRR